MAEYKGFVFCVCFMLFYTSFLGGMPSGLSSTTYDNPALSQFDPALLTGFTSTETYNKTNYSVLGSLYYYDYELGGHYFRATYQSGVGFKLGEKVLFFGLWLGALDYQEFTFEGVDRGTEITFTELIADNSSGQVRYNILSTGGGWVFAWDTDTYSTPSDAWDSSDLQLLHGVGADSNAPTNMLGLLLGLMFLQIPDIPTMLQVLIIAPVWASVFYLSWFIIKEVLPFV